MDAALSVFGASTGIRQGSIRVLVDQILVVRHDVYEVGLISGIEISQQSSCEHP
jgi:hypothetical protein